jgi:hypothetical protein
MSTTERWRSRIVGTGDENPAALQANPANWRRHPESQRLALGEVLQEVGWVSQVIVNRTTGNLVDGHLRVTMAVDRGEATVPVVYVDLTADEERLVLATLDPLAALAETDTTALQALVNTLSIDGELDALLHSLLPPPVEDGAGGDTADYLEALSVSLAEPDHKAQTGDVWSVGTSFLCVTSVYDGWSIYLPLLTGDRMLVPYPTPILPLTDRARRAELVMVQPDEWLAGHLLDKYAEVYGEGEVERLP